MSLLKDTLTNSSEIFLVGIVQIAVAYQIHYLQIFTKNIPEKTVNMPLKNDLQI